MITVYSNGDAFLKANSSFLNENRYMSVFFYMDAPLINEPNKINYLLEASQGNKKLLGVKLEPFNLILYGDKDCLEELLIFIKENDYELNGVICSQELGEHLIKISKPAINMKFYQQIGMDFMSTTEYTEESSLEVEHATIDDVDELFECEINFIKDCGLTDIPKKENVIKKLNSTRIIRRDDKIAAVCCKSPDTDKSLRVSFVYTRPEYRGQGLARKVVNYIKNEILSEGKIATLNVDQANPISYHLYQSLGFKKEFSQGIYLIKE